MPRVGINLSTGSLQQEQIVLGIDLGTTNSLASYVNSEGNPVIIDDCGQESLVPSVIYFKDDGEAIVGTEAEEQIVHHPERTVFSVKRLLGRSFGDIKEHQRFFSYTLIDAGEEELVKIKINARVYSPIELSSLILSALKKRAERTLKIEVQKAVITVPAYFNDAQRNATRDAGKLAGIDVLRIVNEPTAASLAYGIGLNADEERTIAVYDLGGGTFDVSILRISGGIFEVLSTNGDTYLGGDDVDLQIINHWVKKYDFIHDDFFKNKSHYQSIRRLAKQAKAALSTKENFEGTLYDNNVSISRKTFETLINGLVERTIDCCKSALKDAQLNHTEIDEVVMVGGSTRIPYVKKRVGTFFNTTVLDTIDPDKVVAMGAALQADILSGKRSDLLLLDVTPLSLGIETIGGLMDVVIPRNSKIPFKVNRNYTTSKDGQKNIKISVFQGEREMVVENRRLAEFILEDIPPMPAGIPKVEVSFTLDENGILTVKAQELRSGVQQSIDLKPSYGLSDEDVEQALMASMKHAKEDIHQRMFVEAKVEAEHIILSTNKFLALSKDTLSEKQKQRIERYVKTLKKAIEKKDKDMILSTIEDLENYTKPFAEALMEKEVSKSLKGKGV